MSRRLSSGLAFVLLALTLAAPRWLSAADPVPTDRLLPSDVALYVAVPDVGELKTQFLKTSMGAISEDSAFEPFKGELLKVLGEISEELQQEIGVPLKDLLNLPDGEVALAIVTPPGKKIAGALFFDFGDNEKTVDTLLEKAEKSLEENGFTGEDEEVDGTQISVWTIKRPDGPNTLAYFVKDSMLVATTDLDSAKGILTRWDGKHSDTFADNSKYNMILEKCSAKKDEGLLVWYLDPMALVRSALTQMAAQNPQLGLVIGFLEPLGINGLKAVGGTVDLATEEFDSVSRTFLIVEPPTKGVLNIFQFPAIEQKPPRWVPANASMWLSVNWDLAGAYKAIESIVDMFSGPGSFSARIDQVAQDEGGPKVHLKKDFIDLIAGRIQVVTSEGKKQGDDPPPERMVVAISLSDTKKFQATLAKVSKTPGFPGTAREFKGATIYEMELPNFGGLGGDPQPGALAIAKDQLFFSNDVTLIESLLRGDEESETLADSAEYKAVAAHLPAKSSIASFSRSDSQLKTLWESARNGSFSDEFPQVDWSKLPDFNAVKKYLQPSGSYAIPDPKGALFIGYGTKKK